MSINLNEVFKEYALMQEATLRIIEAGSECITNVEVSDTCYGLVVHVFVA